MSRRITIGLLGVVPMLLAGTLRLEGQASGAEPMTRGPQFLVASKSSGQPVRADVNRLPVLRQRISVAFDGVPLRAALAGIAAKSGLRLEYSDAVVPLDRTVHLTANDITVAAALTVVLLDADVDVMLEPSGLAMLVRRTDTAGRRVAGTIVGRVTDAKTGEGLGGAEVFLEGTGRRTASGEDGRYRLVEVEPGSYTLAVRRVGYAKQSRAVEVAEGAELAVDVALQPVPTQLNEIVTTVTGEQRRVELGHVVGRINADSLVKEAPVSSLSELLNGRVPGLQVFQNQGIVGGEVQLQVRGQNSLLLSNEPIVIVDGVRYTSGVASGPFSGNGPGNVEGTSRLNDLNPNDIESIEVVKGPSAATLYGTDAANGVIVITTKRGRPGPPRWNVYAKASRTTIPTTSYTDNYWGWRTIGGVPSTTINCTLWDVAAGSCTQDSVAVLPSPLNDPDLTVLGRSPQYEYGANVSGGREELRYYFSGDFEHALGAVQMPPAVVRQLQEERGVSELPKEQRDPNALTRLNLRANVATRFASTGELRLQAGYTRTATRTAGRTLRNPYQSVLTATPASPYGRFGGGPAQLFSQTSTESTDRFFGAVGGDWQPTSWLRTRATVGLDLSGSNRYSLARRGEVPDDPSGFANGAVGDDRIRQVATTVDVGVTATGRTGRLSSRTSVGAQYVRTLRDGLSSFGTDLPPGGTSVGEAATVETGQTYSETITLGSYVEETIGWNERLFLTGALRVDGASAFGRNYDATVYPKVSASWLVSEEPFLPRVPGLDELRLRYAYGASGQQPRPEWARPGFRSEPVILNGAPTTVIGTTALGNPDLRPERVREHEFGFDASGLQGRVQLGATWYRRRTVDQIVLLQLPPGLGSTVNLSSHYSNLGLTTQRGFEVQLTGRLLDTRALSWDVGFQYGSHATKLVDLGDTPSYGTPFGGYQEGYALGARFQRPIVQYADANGDGIITAAEVERGDTSVYAGESTPPRSQTLTTTVGLFNRRLRLSALLERRTGFTQADEVNHWRCRYGLCRGVVDPATPLAEQAVATAVRSSGYRVIEPGDFTRLREVTAVFELPSGVARALRMRSATLALSARNLALWTDFSGPDPESADWGTGVSVQGGTAGGIPQGRSWTLRLDLGL